MDRAGLAGLMHERDGCSWLAVVGWLAVYADDGMALYDQQRWLGSLADVALRIDMQIHPSAC